MGLISINLNITRSSDRIIKVGTLYLKLKLGGEVFLDRWDLDLPSWCFLSSPCFKGVTSGFQALPLLTLILILIALLVLKCKNVGKRAHGGNLVKIENFKYDMHMCM